MTGNLEGQDGPPEDLEAALAVIEATRDLSFLERFKRLGLDPKSNFAGGDWRNCDFSKGDLREADFRNSRLFRANFRAALVSGADFRGAGDVHTANIHLAIDWRHAYFDDYQLVLIDARLEKLRQYKSETKFQRVALTEKEWFFAIKACPSFSEALQVLEHMEIAGFQLNPFAYSYVLDRAKRGHKLSEGWELFESFIRAGGQADAPLYTAGIGVAPNGETALRVFEDLKEFLGEDDRPDQRAYNMAISKQADDVSTALRLMREMKSYNVEISRHTIYALFDACRDFANAVTVLMEARKAGVDIDDESFLQELTATSKYPDLDRERVRIWKSDGLSPRAIIGELVGSILRDPFRTDALRRLGFSR